MRPDALPKAQAAYNAGFRGTALAIITALGLSESGSDPTVINNNPSTGDYSVGWWQVNYYGNLAPGRISQFGAPVWNAPLGDSGNYTNPPSIQTPDGNAAAAYALSGGGQTFAPWQADFDNGNVYRNMPDALAAAAQVTGGPVSPGAIGTPSATFMAAQAAGNPGGSGPTTTTPTDHCLISLPSAKVPIIGTNLGGGCIFSTSQARAVGGVLLMIGGVLIAGVGIVLLVGKGNPIPKFVPGAELITRQQIQQEEFMARRRSAEARTMYADKRIIKMQPTRSIPGPTEKGFPDDKPSDFGESAA